MISLNSSTNLYIKIVDGQIVRNEYDDYQNDDDGVGDDDDDDNDDADSDDVDDDDDDDGDSDDVDDEVAIVYLSLLLSKSFAICPAMGVKLLEASMEFTSCGCCCCCG